MGSEWKEFTIEELARPEDQALATGPFGSSISSKYFQNTGVPVIRGSNLSQNVKDRLLDKDIVFVSNEKAKSFKRSIARKGDLVFTCWGTINQIGFIDERARFKEYVISNKQMKLTPNLDLVDPEFLYYIFQSPEKQDEILSNSIGSSVPGFNLGQLKAHKVKLPPLSEQKAIAHVLGSLDDKIELNRRMNATLEGLAQALFQSWFVDFDPVLDNALAAGNPIPDELADRAALRRQALDNGTANREAAQHFPANFQFTEELGWIPEGWEVKDFGDIAKNIRNSVDPKSLPEDTPYVGLEHIDRKVFSLTRWGYASEVDSQKAQFEENDFLFGKLRPYFHKICQVQTKGICSTDILVIRPKNKILSGFVGCQIFESEFVEYANLRSTGTRMPRASWKDMAKYEIPFPESDLIETFNMLVQPMRDKCKKTINESRTLTKLRDTLLPQLISGELQIPDAEKLTEDALV